MVSEAAWLELRRRDAADLKSLFGEMSCKQAGRAGSMSEKKKQITKY